MYKIDPEVFLEFSKLQDIADSYPFPPHVNFYPDHQLRKRIQAIYDRILSVAGLKVKTQLFVSSSPFIDREAYSDDVGDVDISEEFATAKTDGQIAAILGHELAHRKTVKTKEALEREMESLGLSGHVTTLSQYKKDIHQAFILNNKEMLSGDKFGYSYLTQESIADRLGILWALKAGFPPQEIKQVTDVLKGSENPDDQKRIPLIKKHLKRFRKLLNK